ncbi:MAG: transposase [Micromonosporaceae bacterium]|nr:transposase [Micromonosporaceae bacterium]
MHTADDRSTVNMISAINGWGLSFFALIDGRCNTGTYTEFYDKLLAEVGGPVFLIVDNAGYHRSKTLQQHLAGKDGQLRILRLPPYSPELNPDELV